MAAEPFELCVPEHITFLAGYMDAVGRVLTTDAELWVLTARDAKESTDNGLVLGAAIHTRSVVGNWSREFGSLVDDFLSMDQRSRLGFNLIDYICWFREFTQHAECFKLECDSLGSGTLGQVVYLLQIESNHRVLLLFQHLDKTNSKRMQSIGREGVP